MSMLVLRPTRASAIGYVVLGLVMTAMGVLSIVAGRLAIGVLGTAFFGLCTAVFVAQLRGGSYLRLDAERFEIATLFRHCSYRWDQIERFAVITIRHGFLPVRRMVGFDFAANRPRGAGLARAIAGCDGALPSSYGKRPDELVALLEARRRAARGP